MEEQLTDGDKQNYSIFTVCNVAYLPRARVLAESVERFTDTKLKIFLVDRKAPIDTSYLAAEVFWIEDLGIPNFYELAFRYEIIELSTSLKPYITLELLKKSEKVIFLDPDTWLFHSADPILSDLDKHDVVLTPHYTTPQGDDPTESDVGMMRFGSFNLGFFAVKRSDESLRFLEWWSARCLRFNYMESQFGLSTDQKWVTIAPCFFRGLHVSFNLGYNAAWWNVHERSFQRTPDGGYIVNDVFPLVFFHFSMFDRTDPEYLKKRFATDLNKRRPDILEIVTAYLEALLSAEANTPPATYSFEYMSGGEYISPTLRRAYACVLPELPLDHDPFDSTGVVGRFARRNALFEKRIGSYTSKSFRDLGDHVKTMKCIYFLMRVVLRGIGPNRFFNLSRLLVFLSSYRQTRGLWKY